MSDNKHENYEILNLIGYGLAKFDAEIEGFNFNDEDELADNEDRIR